MKFIFRAAIAFWCLSLVCDVFSLYSRNAGLNGTAFFALVSGLALGFAAFGLHWKNFRLYPLQAVLIVSAFALYAWDIQVRQDAAAFSRIPVFISAAAFLMIGIADGLTVYPMFSSPPVTTLPLSSETPVYKKAA
jgi:hypothetical protein